MKKPNIFTSKPMLIWVGSIILFLASAGGSILFLHVTYPTLAKTTNDATTNKTITPSTDTISGATKSTSTMNDIQTDLNNINSQTTNLDGEINSVTNGLNDQQTDLTY